MNSVTLPSTSIIVTALNKNRKISEAECFMFYVSNNLKTDMFRSNFDYCLVLVKVNDIIVVFF
jgi:hypothetical protein